MNYTENLFLRQNVYIKQETDETKLSTRCIYQRNKTKCQSTKRYHKNYSL